MGLSLRIRPQIHFPQDPVNAFCAKLRKSQEFYNVLLLTWNVCMQSHTSPPIATESTLHLLDCGVALFDRLGRVLFWNSWLRTASGISSQGACGKTLTEIFSASVHSALVAAVEKVCAEGWTAPLLLSETSRPLPLHQRASASATARSERERPMEHLVHIQPIPRARSGGHAVCLMQVSDVSALLARERYLSRQQVELRLRNRALEASSQGIIITDARQTDNPVIYANPAFSRITGYREDEVLGRNCRFLQGPESDQSGLQTIREALRERREGIATVKNYRKDGTWFWNELLVSPVFNETGELTNFVGIQRDISPRRTAEDARDEAKRQLEVANETLRHEKKLIQTVMRTTGALVVILDRYGVVTSVNRACEVAFGRNAVSMEGMLFTDFLPEGQRTSFSRMEHGGMLCPQGLHTPIHRPNGETRTVRWTFGSLTDDAGAVTSLICTGIDVTERERAMALLSGERRILEMVARAEPLEGTLQEICMVMQGMAPELVTSILLLDSSGTAVENIVAPSVSSSYRELMQNVAVGPDQGTSGVAAFLGRPHYTFDILSDPNWHPYRAVAEQAGVRCCWAVPVLSSSRSVLGTFVTYGPAPRLPDGGQIEMLHRAARICSIAIERHQAAERIRHLALYDQLTGLANRTLLSEKLYASVAHATRFQSQIALLFIDLDGFKPINDVHGHDAGDAVLSVLGRRLKDLLRPGDVAARIGGDEFVILAEGGEVGVCEAAAAQLAQHVLETIFAPIPWRGKELRVGASIGVALYPQHGRDPDTLLTAADNAMYVVKQTGKNHWRFAEAKA